MNNSGNHTQNFLQKTRNSGHLNEKFQQDVLKEAIVDSKTSNSSYQISGQKSQQQEAFDQQNNLERQSDDVLNTYNIYDLEKTNYKLFIDKDYNTCDKIQQKLIQMVQQNPEYYHQQALTYIALNDLEIANKYYKKALQISNKNDLYFLIMIQSELPTNFLQSIKYISNKIYNYKDIKNQLIAECLFSYHIHVSERPQKAMKMLQILISRYSKCYLPYLYACKCCISERNYDRALDFINQAIRNFRYKDIQLLNLKGVIHELSGNYTDALKIYSQFPENLYFKKQLNLIKAKICSIELQGGMKELQQQIKFTQISTQELQNQEQGIQFYQMKKYDESIDQLIKAIQINPQSGLCYVMLAKCYIKLGNLENAYSYYHKALDYYEDQQRLIRIFDKITNEQNRRITLENISWQNQ